MWVYEFQEPLEAMSYLDRVLGSVAGQRRQIVTECEDLSSTAPEGDLLKSTTHLQTYAAHLLRPQDGGSPLAES